MDIEAKIVYAVLIVNILWLELIETSKEGDGGEDWSSEDRIDGTESRSKSCKREGEQVGVVFGVLKTSF